MCGGGGGCVGVGFGVVGFGVVGVVVVGVGVGVDVVVTRADVLGVAVVCWRCRWCWCCR